jgi:hypothetical protein
LQGSADPINSVATNRLHFAQLKKAMIVQTPFLTRYLVRMGSKGWMVWDRQTGAPGRLEEGRPAVDLTEERAREIRDELNKKHIADR